MNLRTDLAMEARDLNKAQLPQGVLSNEYDVGDIKVTSIEVKDEEAAKIIGKPIGNYITITSPPFSKTVETAGEQLEAVANELKKLLPDGLILVVGLGNDEITPDALGPIAVAGILSTRHIKGELAKAAGLEGLRPVAAIAPGVLGQTGMETGEIIASLVKEVKPAAVIAIDALASMSLTRLGTTIQITDCGINPGSGVGNMRKELSEHTLGVPCIGIGVPTVVDATTLACDLFGAGEELKAEVKEKVQPSGGHMMVTPREVDLLVKRAGKLISQAINLALQPDISLEDMELLTC